jgi:hypothetical protein
MTTSGALAGRVYARRADGALAVRQPLIRSVSVEAHLLPPEKLHNTGCKSKPRNCTSSGQLNLALSRRRVEVKSPYHSEATMKPSQRSEPTSTIPDPTALAEQIRRRAYQIYEARAREDGHDQDDWLRAEAEILGTRRKAAAA